MGGVYSLQIGDIIRNLPIVKISDDLSIASFVMLGDTELVITCAEKLYEKIKEIDFDIMVGAEAKAIPLLQVLAMKTGCDRYIICRKQKKAYMTDIIKSEVDSITTNKTQKLVLDKNDINLVKNKKVLLVDDVVSTGNTIKGMESLIEKAGGKVVGKASVLKEGNFYDGNLVYLKDLPLFKK